MGIIHMYHRLHKKFHFKVSIEDDDDDDGDDGTIRILLMGAFGGRDCFDLGRWLRKEMCVCVLSSQLVHSLGKMMLSRNRQHRRTDRPPCRLASKRHNWLAKKVHSSSMEVGIHAHHHHGGGGTTTKNNANLLLLLTARAQVHKE
uniref:Uncharacterized protein n=1 Tax=Grammatophora oceanica TaxID=210454 RepID=A0A7S1V4K0_9STRA|mmetsp:Transcript_36248/g.54107  ORF Transcript_36248/g.54107 Transcript_36248/m.54107 type:complete len:145 (+) Transcript_36248:94-528(+)